MGVAEGNGVLVGVLVGGLAVSVAAIAVCTSLSDAPEEQLVTVTSTTKATIKLLTLSYSS